MENRQGNTIKRILIALVLFFVVFSGFKIINKPTTVEGEKAISIIVMDKEANKAIEETYHTDGLLLGDLIDEINEAKETFVLDGTKDSEFGRFILEIVGVEKADDEFWVYDSENNKVCEAEEFCPGIDALAIEDADIFTFSILD